MCTPSERKRRCRAELWARVRRPSGCLRRSALTPGSDEVCRLLYRHSPDEPRNDANICAFPAFPQDRRAVPTAATILRAWTAVGQPDLAVFLGIWSHSCRWLLLNA